MTESQLLVQEKHKREQINRIRRIQGQLQSLAHMIESGDGSCAERVIRARTVEKAMNSLVTNFVICYIESDDFTSDSAVMHKELSQLLRLLRS